MSYLRFLVLGLLFAIVVPASALAQAKVTYVSGKGVDTSTCASVAQPCRSFAYALGQTAAFGTIQALDPSSFGAVTITKSVAISGVAGASIGAQSGDAIIVNAGANGVVSISRLTLEGGQLRNHGIVLNSAASLTITDSVLRNFRQDAIRVQITTGRTRFMIQDVISANNGGSGIYVVAHGAAVTQGVINRTTLHANYSGLRLDRSSNEAMATVTVTDSIASANTDAGFHGAARGGIVINRSVSVGNGTGIFVNTTVASSGTNLVYGNTTNNVGTPAQVPLQ